MIEENKLTLMGDEIAYGIPSKIKAFCRSTEVVVSSLSTLFLLAHEAVCSPGGDLGGNVGAGVFITGCLLCLFKAMKKEEADLLAPQAKCSHKFNRLWINTRPEKRAIDANQVVWMNNAERFAGYQARGIAAAGLLGASVTTILGLTGAPAMDAMFGGFMLSFVFGARFIEGRHRWNKVAKGDWIVEDREPPRRKVPVAVKAEKKRFGFLLPAYGV